MNKMYLFIETNMGKMSIIQLHYNYKTFQILLQKASSLAIEFTQHNEVK